MNKYYICRSITSAEGWQQYSCKANSKEEALKKFNEGDDEFICEEVEVQGLDEISIEDISTEP